MLGISPSGAYLGSDGACLGSDGLLPNGLSTYLGQPKDLELGKDTWKEASHNDPNPSNSIWFPHRPNTYDLMDRGGVTSTNGRPQQGGQKNARVGHSRPNRQLGLVRARIPGSFLYFEHHLDSTNKW
ncbi:hypothetical protein CK203_063766 [Vitis vinifera]|uniref:Uncharacterized protein n=1 Tax=Vitis vinifera TaxID=29760 RepID=A0A438GZX8_VITVI|nr:hypothetical protein CK203_063766 [Vitis vinifera]